MYAKMSKKGQITIPKAIREKLKIVNEGAVLFLEYMLSPNGGLKVLERMGQPPFLPCRVPSDEMKEKIPGTLQNLTEVKK